MEGENLILTYEGITIKVKVTDIHGKQVKIGFEVPWEAGIARQKITE